MFQNDRQNWRPDRLKHIYEMPLFILTEIVKYVHKYVKIYHYIFQLIVTETFNVIKFFHLHKNCLIHKGKQTKKKLFLTGLFENQKVILMFSFKIYATSNVIFQILCYHSQNTTNIFFITKFLDLLIKPYLERCNTNFKTKCPYVVFI